MTTIIGYGNTLRAEDGFGCDVITQLKKYNIKNTELISVFQLTPELCEKLQNSTKILFVDSTFSDINHYSLACNLMKSENINLSHHISVQVIIKMLNELYNTYPKVYIFSMLTNNFNSIKDKEKYFKCVDRTSKFISQLEPNLL